MASQDSWAATIYYIRWILNAIFVAMPWCMTVLILIGFNLYESIAWQQWWAYGNIIVLGRTLYLVFQGLLSIPLIFEIDVYLRHMKWIRAWSF